MTPTPTEVILVLGRAWERQILKSGHPGIGVDRCDGIRLVRLLGGLSLLHIRFPTEIKGVETFLFLRFMSMGKRACMGRYSIWEGIKREPHGCIRTRDDLVEKQDFRNE